MAELLRKWLADDFGIAVNSFERVRGRRAPPAAG